MVGFVIGHLPKECPPISITSQRETPRETTQLQPAPAFAPHQRQGNGGPHFPKREAPNLLAASARPPQPTSRQALCSATANCQLTTDVAKIFQKSFEIGRNYGPLFDPFFNGHRAGEASATRLLTNDAQQRKNHVHKPNFSTTFKTTRSGPTTTSKSYYGPPQYKPTIRHSRLWPATTCVSQLLERKIAAPNHRTISACGRFSPIA